MSAGWIFEPHSLFRGNLDGEEMPYGYISEGVGKPIFALHEVLGERSLVELADAARLIASAPDLLDALESIAGGLTLPGLFRIEADQLRAAHAAIARARGDAA